MSSGQTHLGSVARGVLAGAPGTAAMTAARTAMMKLRGAGSLVWGAGLLQLPAMRLAPPVSG
jgi:hypothetical protein